jgi:hypothetical protein
MRGNAKELGVKGVGVVEHAGTSRSEKTSGLQA